MSRSLRPLRTLRSICVAFALAAASDQREGLAEELTVSGLSQPVEILRDRWGIAHIYARNEHDLFFAQGFNVARDRLFQLELWRRQATGTVAEIQGPRALGHDLGARLLKFRGDMASELNRYHPQGDRIIPAFVQGINASIALTEREPQRLPLEFRVLGIRPGRWTPEVVVSRHNGLYRNVVQEVQYARLVHVLGRGRARELLNLHPGRPRLEPDAALDLGQFQQSLLELYQGSHASIRFLAEDVEPAYRDSSRKVASEGRQIASEPHTAGLPPIEDATQGSNNWVISGEQTFTRAPIMANDPHRVIQVPSLRYWVI